jgi:hypothetical protein
MAPNQRRKKWSGTIFWASSWELIFSFLTISTFTRHAHFLPLFPLLFLNIMSLLLSILFIFDFLSCFPDLSVPFYGINFKVTSADIPPPLFPQWIHPCFWHVKVEVGCSWNLGDSTVSCGDTSWQDSGGSSPSSPASQVVWKWPLIILVTVVGDLDTCVRSFILTYILPCHSVTFRVLLYAIKVIRWYSMCAFKFICRQ